MLRVSRSFHRVHQNSGQRDRHRRHRVILPGLHHDVVVHQDIVLPGLHHDIVLPGLHHDAAAARSRRSRVCQVRHFKPYFATSAFHHRRHQYIG